MHHEVEDMVKALNAKLGSAVIINPDNGHVISMSNWPEFDPNRVGVPSLEMMKNPIINECYEFGSQDGSEERDATPLSAAHNGVPASKPGKFWVYERIIRIPYYGIFLVNSGEFEMYESLAGRYQRMHPNDRGHYAIPPLQVEIGVWQGAYQNQTQPWLRWWDREGNLLLTGQERAEQEHQRAEQERQRAEQERQRAEQERQRAEQECQRADEAEARAARLAERLRELGIDPI